MKSNESIKTVVWYENGKAHAEQYVDGVYKYSVSKKKIKEFLKHLMQLVDSN